MKLGRGRDREKVRHGGARRSCVFLQPFIFLCALVTGCGLLILALRPLDPPIVVDFPREFELGDSNISSLDAGGVAASERVGNRVEKSCATVEEMGNDFRSVDWKETQRVRRIIENHFVVNGNSRFFISFCCCHTRFSGFTRPLDFLGHKWDACAASIFRQFNSFTE